MSNTPHSIGSRQPPVTHSRPFFYVQPPSHPYYMCQWQMNSPFGHYGLPVSGMPFGRPYLSPYPYMQYPGYIVPHAPMQPIDYRRMFAPHLLPMTTYDVRFRQYCNQQTRVRRETATSEVQTEPSDLVNELIASLGRLQTCTSTTGVEKDLESTVVSQASGTSACSEEVGDCEGPNRELEPLPQRHRPTRESFRNCLPSSRNVQLQTSTVFNTGSSQSPLGDLVHPECWPVGPDEEPPIDSSSVHEETVVVDAELPQQSCLPERVWSSGMQGDGPGSATHITDGSKAQPDHQTQEVEHCDITSRQSVSPSQTSSPGPPSPNSSSSLAVDSVAPDSQRVSEKSSQLHPADRKDLLEKPAFDVENLPYRILQLPCDKMTTAGMLQKGSPLWCVDSAFLPPSSYLSSLGNALYYSYYPQTSQERQSVLSPSLEELSSRDELFSTDLEDMDLIPGHVYAGGGGGGGGGGWVTSTAKETLCSEVDVPCSSSQEACREYQKKMCSVCSSHLSKVPRRRPRHGLGSCGCAEGESDAETEEDSEMLQSVCGHRKTAVSKHQVQRSQQLQGQQSSKQKTKPGTENLTNQEEREQSILREHQCCKEHRPISKAERSRDLELKRIKSRPCVDKQWCGDHDLSDQESWESCSVKPRPRGYKVHPSQGQEKATRRRVPSKTLARQRHKRKDLDDEAELPGQKGKSFGVALPPNAYMETPGFVVFPAQLPLGDHRALNSHYPPAQRFRRQAPSAQKEMVSFGVQTEAPFLGRSDPQFSRSIECAGPDSGRGTACSNSTPASSPTFGVCLQERTQVTNTTADVKGAPGSTCVVGMGNGWRQTCTPLDELPAGEPCGDGNLVERDAYPSEGLVPVYASSAHESNLCMDSGKQGGQQSPSCPRVQLGEGLPPPSMDVLHSGCEASQAMLESVASQHSEKPNSGADYIEENMFKIIKLPFSIQYMVDFKKMANQSMWSESLAIYVPSAEWTVWHELLLSEKEGDITVNDCSKSQDAITLEGLDPDLSSKGQRESISSVDSLPPCIPASSWLADISEINHYSKLSLAVQEQECILRTPADLFTLRGRNLDSKSHKSHELEKCKCKKSNWEGSCQSATCISAAKGNCVQCVNGRKINFWAWKNTDSIQRQMVQSSSLMDRTHLSRTYMRSIPNQNFKLEEGQEGSTRKAGQHLEQLF